MKPAEYSRLQDFFSTPRKVVITTHRAPDGDAIGSSLAMYHYLLKKGHQPQVITPDDYPGFLQWLPGNDHVLRFHADRKEAIRITRQAEVIFCLDFNALERLEAYGGVVGNSRSLKVLIDHHQQPQDFPDFALSDTSASSTAQLVYDFIAAMGDAALIDRAIAQCLYTGIMTDTGSFRFSSTSAHTHRIVAELIDAGLEVSEVHQRIFDANSADRLRLLGYSISEKLEVFPEHATSLISLSAEELKRFNFQRGDTEGVVNYALSVSGTTMAALITEQDNLIKLSLRSKGGFDVNTLARKHFEGGGHKNAAGGRSRLTFAETVDAFKALLPEYSAQLNQA